MKVIILIISLVTVTSLELIQAKPCYIVSGMLSLDNLKKEKVVPEVIERVPDATIFINYKSLVSVEQGNELKPTQVKDEPEFNYAHQSDQLYTLIMVDPDAPSRKDPKLGPILHYMVANIPGNDVEKGDVLAEYIGSGPPQGTGLHRYIFLLYRQKDGRLTSDLKITKTSRKGRVNFALAKWVKDHNLGKPIAANFYQAQYDDYVPTLHAQLSQG